MDHIAGPGGLLPGLEFSVARERGSLSGGLKCLVWLVVPVPLVPFRQCCHPPGLYLDRC